MEQVAPNSTEAKKQQQTEDILNSILPPREWQESGQLWVQSVSSTPATRVDVIKLQEALDTKLSQRQARETGIDPVRRELYSQVFGSFSYPPHSLSPTVVFGCSVVMRYLIETVV